MYIFHPIFHCGLYWRAVYIYVLKNKNSSFLSLKSAVYKRERLQIEIGLWWRAYGILWINLPEKNLFKINLLTSENLYISFFLDIINFLLNFHSISKPFLLHSSQTVICQFSNLLSMRIIGIWNFWNKILKLKFIYSEKATKFGKLFW